MKIPTFWTKNPPKNISFLFYLQTKEQEEEIFQLQEITTHTNVLENSLQDIAFMVSNDEKDIQIDEVDLSIAPRIRLRSGTPDLKKQGSFGERRRTRSASPAVTESTLSAVQRFVLYLCIYIFREIDYIHLLEI